MKLEFTFKSVQRVGEETAQLDSGASENFVDEDIWKGLSIGRVRLQQPIPVYNVDGTENRSGRIEYYCWLRVKLGKNAILLNKSGKRPFYPKVPFLEDLQPTGRPEDGTIA